MDVHRSTSFNYSPSIIDYWLLAFALILFGGHPVLAACLSGHSRPLGEPEGCLLLTRCWTIQSAARVPQSGSVISQRGFDAQSWYPTDVPTTVLAALVRDKIYPDPDSGMNLRSIPGTTYPIGANFANIPMPPGSPFAVGWWYRDEFNIPNLLRSKRVWLHFDGINYRATIWMNGQRVADDRQVAGTWRTYEFNVTRFVRSGVNVLAVEVFAPTPDDLSLTFVDWNPMPPDKDMGLFRKVFLTSTGPVAVRYPQVITRLDLPSLAEAHVTVSADVANASNQAITGELKARFGSIELDQSVRLAPGRTRRVTFTPQAYPHLNLSRPRLWWPWLYGPQNLYRLQLEFVIDGEVSDRREVTFGVREITSELDARRHRLFLVNGKKILIRGAGWAPDMLMRLSARSEEDQLAYVRGMNLNAVRLEGKPLDQHFYDLCDRNGILVLQGWCCCSRWERWKEWGPEDYKIAAASLRDQLRRLRNHPCMLAWLYGSDNAPPAKAEANYLKALREERWPNPYIAAASARKTPGAGWTGVKMTGPYQYVAPSYWYVDHAHGGAFGFNTETSPGPAIPLIPSLKQMLPARDLWPINDVWNFHAGGGHFTSLDIYNRALEERYGPFKNLRDYVEKSQLAAYEGERAMFEAYGRNKYTSTGVIQWMLGNGWPSLIWHLYDYYLRPGGGYFGTQEACKPLHVQYSYDDRSVVVVNSYRRSFSGYRIEAQVLNLDLSRKFSKTVTADFPSDSSTRVFTIPRISGLSKTYFVRLRMENRSGRVVDRSFYWLSTRPDVFNWKASTWYYTPLSSYADFRDLQTLPRVMLLISSAAMRQGSQEEECVTVRNPTSHLAFFVHLRVLAGEGGGDVHPILWNDNYFELMPGESREVKAVFHASELQGALPVAAVDGWNVKPTEVSGSE